MGGIFSENENFVCDGSNMIELAVFLALFLCQRTSQEGGSVQYPGSNRAARRSSQKSAELKQKEMTEAMAKFLSQGPQRPEVTPSPSSTVKHPPQKFRLQYTEASGERRIENEYTSKDHRVTPSLKGQVDNLLGLAHMKSNTVLLHGSDQTIESPKGSFWTTVNWWEAARFADKAAHRPESQGTPTINMYVLKYDVTVSRLRVADTELRPKDHPHVDTTLFLNDHRDARRTEGTGWWKPQEEDQIMFRKTSALEWIGEVTAEGHTIDEEKLQGPLYAVNLAPPVSPIRQPRF